MNFMLESSNRIARRTYTCDYCGKGIEYGEHYHYYKGVCDGRIYDWHSHMTCANVADAIYDYCNADESDGMSAELFRDGCYEVCNRFICPDCSRWNQEYEGCVDDKLYCIDRMDEFFKTHELYKDRKKMHELYKDREKIASYYEIWKCREKERKEFR